MPVMRMQRTPKEQPASSPRQVVRYLGQIRPLLATVLHDRQEWLRKVGMLIEEARTATPQLVAQHAGRIGREQIALFRETRREVDAVTVPAGCAACHTALGRWIDTLSESCEVLIDVGITGKLARVKETQTILAEGRAYARQFNRAQNELVADLRARIRPAA